MVMSPICGYDVVITTSATQIYNEVIGSVLKKNKIIFNNRQNKWVIPHSQHNSNYCTMLCKDFTPSTSLKTKY